MGCDKIPHSVKVSITQFGEVAERLTNLPGANLDSAALAELAPQG